MVRQLALVLAASLAFGLVAGCNDNGDETTKALPKTVNPLIHSDNDPDTKMGDGSPTTQGRSSRGARVRAGLLITEQQFVDKATTSNLFQIESSKVALDRAMFPATRAFAQRVINDHSKVGVELKAAAAKAGVAVPTIGLTERAQLNLLADYEGDAFDQSFLAEQYASHETTVALFSAYLTDARHGSLREFAAKTLPALQQGLEEVQWLATRSF